MTEPVWRGPTANWENPDGVYRHSHIVPPLLVPTGTPVVVLTADQYESLTDPSKAAQRLIEAGHLTLVGTVRWMEEPISPDSWPVIQGSDDSVTGELVTGDAVYRLVLPTEETNHGGSVVRKEETDDA